MSARHAKEIRALIQRERKAYQVGDMKTGIRLSAEFHIRLGDYGRLAADAISANLAGDVSALRDYGAKVRVDFERAMDRRDQPMGHGPGRTPRHQ
jgi:hypothetical protein